MVIKVSKIDELLKNEKVERKKLWEVTIWDKKFNGVEKYKQKKVKKYHYYLAKELKNLIHENGNVRILTTNATNIYAFEEEVKDNVSYGEVVCIPWGGNPIVQYFKGSFITGDNRIATSVNKEILDNKFLYYYLLNNIDYISSLYRGSGIKHPDMYKVLDMEIPIPSIKKQKKIVETLDKFTNYVNELQAELQARNKQYSYYRDLFLSEDYLNKLSMKFELTNFQVKCQNLEDITYITSGGDIPKESYSNVRTEKFNIPIISNGVGENAIYGFTDKAKINEDAVTISARGTIGYAQYRNYPFYPIVRLLSLMVKDKSNVNIKYLYYLMQDKKYNLPPTGIPQLTIPMLKKIKVILPSIYIQNKVVEVLDRFQELIENSRGLLPEEIEKRQKQYEYYRKKLLTFDENMIREREREREREHIFLTHI